MKDKKLGHYLGARTDIISGLTFLRYGVSFRLFRVGSGRGISGMSSYPVLECYTRPFTKFILGHEQSGKYALGKFLILPDHEIFQVAGKKFLIGSNDIQIRKKMEAILADDIDTSALLFQKYFSHLTLSSRIDVGWPLFQKKSVLQFIGLPEEVYAYPELINSYLQGILKIKQLLDV